MPVSSDTDEAEHLRSPEGPAPCYESHHTEIEALVHRASVSFGVSIALISLFEGERQWILADVDLPGVTGPGRDATLRGCVVGAGGLLEIHDAAADARLADHPLVTGEPGIRFYAGVPLRRGGGAIVGTLCLIDRQPRTLDKAQREILQLFASAASLIVENQRLKQLHQQAENALQARTDHLHRFYNETPAMLCSVDKTGRLLTVSQRWMQKLGYAKHEVIGRPLTDFLRADSESVSPAHAPSIWHPTRPCEDVQCQLVHKDGSLLDGLLSSIVDAVDDRGRPCSLAIIEDVTSRRQVERGLMAEHQRLINLIDSSGLGTWEWNLQTGEVKFNERWANLLGHTLAELEPLSSRTWFDHMHPDDIGNARTLLEQHLRGETAQYDAEFRVRHKDGHWLWVLSRGAIVTHTADGDAEWLFGTRKDISARKQQEEALRKSQDLLERTGRAAGVGGWELDLLTEELHWTRETYRIHGLPPDYQPTLESAIAFYAAPARPVISRAVERAMAEGESFDLELPFIRADGREIWVRSVGGATFVGGRAVRLTGAFQDITDRVAQREELQQANERIKLATDSGGIGIWDWDLIDDRLSWDAQMYRLYGTQPPDDADNYRLWSEHLHPADRAAQEQAVQDALAGRAQYDTEFRVIWDDGSVHHIRAAGHVTQDTQGRALRLVGVDWDVTDSRKLAAELMQRATLQAEASERERALFENSADILGILEVRKEQDETIFVYESISPALLHITGWSPEDFIGKRIDQCLPASGAHKAIEECRSCIALGKTVSFQVAIDTPKGRREFEGFRTPIRKPGGGEIVRIAMAIHDVTERNRLQAAEHHSHKMEAIGRLAAGVAHDFNNILQSISGSLELVQDEVPGGSPAHDYAGLGLRSTKRGASLTQHLLAYARKQFLRPRLVDLAMLLADIEKLLARTLGPHISVKVRVDEAAQSVRVDPGQLQTALLNLAINASHAMTGGGELLITTRASTEGAQDWVCIMVADTGAGMDSDTLARATEPFFSTKGLDGTGLGLSMVQGFVEQSGGRLNIHSVLGAGTTVTLHLPAVVSPAQPHMAAAPHTGEKSGHILLVDDDPDVLVTTGAFLEKAGFTAIRARNANEALARMADGSAIDALVTDYAMPGMNGGDLITEVRSHRPGLPAIIISGFTELAEAKRVTDATIVLHKPFPRDALVIALRLLLGWDVADHTPISQT